MECSVQKNAKSCSCTYPGCSRKGRCCECVEFHRRSNELPGCFFSQKDEATYDRSIAFFVRRNR